MKVLVTGCAGFIGSHVAAKLLKDGHDVLGVDNFDVYYSRSQKEKNLLPILLNPKFKLVEDNLATMALVKVLKGTEVVVHLAAQAGVRSSWGASFHKYVTNNILATQRLLEESKSRKLKRFIYASSSSVYGDIGEVLNEEMMCRPKSPYGVTKLAAEHLCQLYHQGYKMPTVALRFFSVYGPGQRPDMAFHRFSQNLLHEAAITIYGDGRQVRDFTYVDDVADIVAASLTADVTGQVVNVGGGSPATLLEAVALMEKVSGKTCTKTFLERQRGDVTATRADTAKLERLFGVKPKTTLEEGLARQWEWMKTFVLGEEEEKAIKANAQPITGVDKVALEEAKAEEKAAKKAKRKEKQNQEAEASAEPEASNEPPEAPPPDA
jgi:UDP-glucose 4-epimerase